MSGSLLFLLSLFTLITRALYPQLIDQLPDIAAFSDITALNFALSGMALLLPRFLSRQNAYLWQRRLGLLLCIIAVISTVEHLIGTPVIRGYPLPALNTNLAFLFAGLFFTFWERVNTHLMASTLLLFTLTIGAIALLGVVGLIIGFDPLFGWSDQVHMTAYTTSGLLILSASLANKVWGRFRNKTLKHVDGVLYLAGVVIVFSALIGGMLIYTIAGANIYNDARQQLRLLAHERAERLHTSLQLTETTSNIIAEQIKHLHHHEKISSILRATQSAISLVVKRADGSESKGYGQDISTERHAVPLTNAGLSLTHMSSGRYYIKQEFSDATYNYLVYYPLPFKAILEDNFLPKHDYNFYICDEQDKTEPRCLKPLNNSPSTIHRFLTQPTYFHVEAGRNHIGITHDYSQNDKLIAGVEIPELHLNLFVSRNLKSIYSSLYHDMLVALPVMLLLLVATITLMIWRIAPLISSLRRNEKQFRLLTENANDMISLHDMDGHYLYASPASRRLLGYTEGELIGHSAYEFFHPDDVPTVSTSHAAVKHSDTIPRITYRIRCKDRKYRWFETASSRISPGAQSAAEIIAVTRDVTDQHDAEERLRASELRYRTLIEEASDAIFLIHDNHYFSEANRAACTMLGYSREELMGMQPEEILLPQDYADARKNLEKTKQRPVTSRRQLLRKDGGLITVETHSKRIQNNEVISIVRDVTEQMHMEQALKQSEQLNRSVIEVLAEGIIVQDTNGIIITSNKAANDILGRSSAETHGKESTDSDWAVIRDDGSPFPGDEHPAMAALTTGQPQRDIIMGVMRPDGERTWISVNADPIFDESGKVVTSVVSSFTDITEKRYSEIELKKSQEQLRALTSHLQEIREDEKEMIAREVHDELGSTMTAMKFGMSWIEQHIGDSDPQLQEKLQTISVQLDKAVLTVRRLVTQLRPTLLDDLGLWAAIEWQLREFAKYTHIEVKDNLHCQQVVLVNRNKALAIYRVIQEALTNIAKHSQASTVRLDCWDRDDSLHITLEDNGIGLTDQTLISPTSHGLRGMSERIATIGGKLEILGTATEGTVITIEVPHDEKGE